MKTPHRFARGVRRQPGAMNKTEQAYAQQLNHQQTTGIILAWWFEPVTLRLAKLTRYTPDFLVFRADQSLEFVEVKGHWEDDARVKIKCAAEKYPMFLFTAVKPVAKKYGGGWKAEVFGDELAERSV
jgi:hypothetical protein